jgi:hypothetical protein
LTDFCSQARIVHLRSGEITDPNHADIATRPGLLRRPFDKVVHVTTFLPIEETEGAARATRAPTVSNDVDVATGDEEVACPSFDESGWSAEILNLSRIGGSGN